MSRLPLTTHLQFDRKSVDDESSEENVDESLTVPTRPAEEDEVQSWSCERSRVFCD